MDSKFMKELRGAIARGWCYPATQHMVLDTQLADAITVEVAKLVIPALQRYRIAVSLLNSMVESGEGHTPSSREIMRRALDTMLYGKEPDMGQSPPTPPLNMGGTTEMPKPETEAPEEKPSDVQSPPPPAPEPNDG